MAIFFLSTSLLSLTTFASVSLLGYPLNPADTFTTASFFSIICVNIINHPSMSIEQLSEVRFASKRIDLFMQLVTDQEHRCPLSISSIDQREKGSIVMSNAFFSWNDDKSYLSSLNLTIEPNTLEGVVKPVGSSKSSLLAAVLGEMNLIHGQIIN